MIEKYLNYLKHVKRYSDNTVRSYEQELSQYQAFIQDKCDLLKIDHQVVKDYLVYLNQKYKNKNTISKKLTTIRAFYQYLVREEIITSNPYAEINNPKKDKKLPRFVKQDQLDKMFQVPDMKNPLGQRNRLILEMLYATGIRVHELVTIKVKDIDFHNQTIKILGKGSKERIVVFGHICNDVLNIYLKDGYQILNKKNSDYLFLNHYGNPITERSIRNILNDIIIKSSLDLHISPHVLRHTFATDMLNNGADLISVKDLLGHESLNTTSIYTHVSNEQIKKIYELAHPRAKE